MNTISHVINSMSLDNFDITSREIDVIKCSMSGKTAKEIAKILVISHRTVEKHLEKIKEKFNCRTKLELMIKILQLT